MNYHFFVSAIIFSFVCLYFFHLGICNHSIIGFSWACFPSKPYYSGLVHYKKFITVSFVRPPQINNFEKFEDLYFRPLLLLSKMTGRLPLLPPPHVVLNFTCQENISDSWLDYYDVEFGRFFFPFTGVAGKSTFSNMGTFLVLNKTCKVREYSANKAFRSGFGKTISAKTDIDFDYVVFKVDNFLKGLIPAIKPLKLRGDLDSVPKPLPVSSWYYKIVDFIVQKLFENKPFLFLDYQMQNKISTFVSLSSKNHTRTASMIDSMTTAKNFFFIDKEMPIVFDFLKDLKAGYQTCTSKNLTQFLSTDFLNNKFKLERFYQVFKLFSDNSAVIN